jgi:hypothetical protein
MRLGVTEANFAATFKGGRGRANVVIPRKPAAGR